MSAEKVSNSSSSEECSGWSSGGRFGNGSQALDRPHVPGGCPNFCKICGWYSPFYSICGKAQSPLYVLLTALAFTGQQPGSQLNTYVMAATWPKLWGLGKPNSFAV